MNIHFYGLHTTEEATESIQDVLHIFRERYKIEGFHEMHLTVTLVDEQGKDVELVDSESGHIYRTFDVYRHDYELEGRKGKPLLKLVSNNSNKPGK